MERIRQGMARAKRMDPFRVDIALAAFGAVAVVAECTFIPSEGHSRAITAVAGVVALVPTAWRRRAPVAAAIGFSLVVALQAFLDSFLILTASTPFVAALVLLYTLGRYATGWPVWAAAAGVVLALDLNLLVDPGQQQTNSLIWGFILFIPPVLAGRAMRGRVLLQRELREKAERLEAEREQRATAAVADERNRIAGELQAVVANSVSAMVVAAEGVPRVLDAGDPARASQAFALIEGTGREALTEMRRLLGVLRRDEEEDAGPALAPQPSLSRAKALIAEIGDGIPVRLRIEGRPRALPPGVDLAAYRVLQEAVTAAAGAGGVSEVDVEIRYGDHDVAVVVTDDRAGDEPDHLVLTAMRERVGLYDGVLRTERRDGDRGYRVTARLPRSEVFA